MFKMRHKFNKDVMKSDQIQYEGHVSYVFCLLYQDALCSG